MARLIQIILIALVPALAFGETPCPESVVEEVPSRGGCEADFDVAPQHFDFDALKKQMDAGRAAEKPSGSAEGESVPAHVGTPGREQPKTCTYSAYAWDTIHKRSTEHFDVSKPYSEVTDDERDPNDGRCTICREDQVAIRTDELGFHAGTILVCHAYADQVRAALRSIAASGQFDIEKLEGYRPGRTRGKIDKNGLRTEWSNHSFGAAIDINAHHNAIYSNCTTVIRGSKEDVRGCKKGIGGAYDPAVRPRTSITRDGVVYREFTKFWKWGGEIAGTTKDIMHFSITGY